MDRMRQPSRLVTAGIVMVVPGALRDSGLVTAIVLLLALGGCAGETPVAARTSPDGGSPTAPGRTSAAVDRSYRAAGLELCPRTDLGPLADLA